MTRMEPHSRLLRTHSVMRPPGHVRQASTATTACSSLLMTPTRTITPCRRRYRGAGEQDIFRRLTRSPARRTRPPVATPPSTLPSMMSSRLPRHAAFPILIAPIALLSATGTTCRFTGMPDASLVRCSDTGQSAALRSSSQAPHFQCLIPVRELRS